MIKNITRIELGTYLTLIVFSFFPLLFSLPFRIHLDLPFEGAYRIYLGQIPYKDFTMPLGYGFLIFPTLCFFVFGPYLKSLLFAQVIISLMGGFSLIGILRNLKLTDIQIFISIFIFCLTYIFIFFWPWYNNTALTFQLVGLYFLLEAFDQTKLTKKLLFTCCATFFIALTFLTKQDYGGLAFLFGAVLALYMAVFKKDYVTFIAYLLSYAAFMGLLIYPFIQYNFFYWFNLGQPPHENRLKPIDILNEIFLHSEWEKFYILAIGLLIVNKFSDFKNYITDQKNVLFFLICFGFVIETLITKVTSKQSLGNTTYFHAFGIAFIIANVRLNFDLRKAYALIPLVALIILWWSGMYWKYATRILKLSESQETLAQNLPEQPETASFEWSLSEFKTMNKVKLPVPTIEGIRRLKVADYLKSKPDAKVLNLTELTMLAEELKYTPLKGLPLWYHLNVGIFQSQVDEICKNIESKTYDLVLFEEIAILDNFFPEQIRESLKKNYKLQDTFLAPRKEGGAFIEVYTP